jgi:hypothetical protein
MSFVKVAGKSNAKRGNSKHQTPNPKQYHNEQNPNDQNGLQIWSSVCGLLPLKLPPAIAVRRTGQRRQVARSLTRYSCTLTLALSLNGEGSS